MQKHKVVFTDTYMEFVPLHEYKFQIHDDFVAENVSIELKEKDLAEEVFFNQSENTITVEIVEENFDSVCEFISEYGFILE